MRVGPMTRAFCFSILCAVLTGLTHSAAAQTEVEPEDGFCGQPAQVGTDAQPLSRSALVDIARGLEVEARWLGSQTEITTAFLTRIRGFGRDAERFSHGLRQAGVEQDLPCIFYGIAADAELRASDLQTADSPQRRATAFTELRVLLDDAILITPMAASALATAEPLTGWSPSGAGQGAVVEAPTVASVTRPTSMALAADSPAMRYRRPFQARGDIPIVAIVIGGLGLNARVTQQAIDEPPPEVTLSFVPYARDLQTWVDRARARGHEVLLELPMESFDANADSGPLTLMTTAPAEQNLSRLDQLLRLSSGYFGVTNYQGARFATSMQAAEPVVRTLQERGFVLITSGIGMRTALSAEAARAGLQHAFADRIIDVNRDPDAVLDQLEYLETLAEENDNALGVGFAYPGTVERVSAWAREANARGFQLAPASAVLDARIAAR